MGRFLKKSAQGSDNLFDFLDCVIGFVNLRFSVEKFNQRLERVIFHNVFPLLASWWQLETKESSILEAF
jgi:hypothetical protein